MAIPDKHQCGFGWLSVYALKSVFNVLVTVLILPPRCVAVFLCCNASAAAFHLRAIDLVLVSDESGCCSGRGHRSDGAGQLGGGRRGGDACQ